jgi:hypothetical protein
MLPQRADAILESCAYAHKRIRRNLKNAGARIFTHIGKKACTSNSL